jgi:hypothetical protein
VLPVSPGKRCPASNSDGCMSRLLVSAVMAPTLPLDSTGLYWTGLDEKRRSCGVMKKYCRFTVCSTVKCEVVW